MTDYISTWAKLPKLRVNPTFTPDLLIQAESGSMEATHQNNSQRIVIKGETVVNSTTPRSYRITRLAHSEQRWQLVASNCYDFYGSGFEIVKALNFLGSFNSGDLLVLTTWDEPNTGRLVISPTLKSSFGSKIEEFRKDWSFRDMHLLVAVKDQGVIFEQHRPRYSDSIHFTGWMI